MALIGHVTVPGFASGQITETQLDGGDTVELTSGNNFLFVRNASGATANLTLSGSTSTGTKNCPGGGQIDLSTPVPVSVPNGEIHALDLNSVRDFLQGAITVTGGAANIFAYVLD